MYKIFMMIFKGRRVYLDNPFPNNINETFRTVEIYKKANPKPYYFVEFEDGTVVES